MNEVKKVDNEDKDFHSTLRHAWVITKLEKDKSLLALSAGGIGLLITLLVTIGVTSLCLFVCFIFAVVLFLICIISVLLILDKNAEHIIKVLKQKEEESDFLKIIDRVAVFAFLAGVIISLIIGISMGAEKMVKGEENMEK